MMFLASARGFQYPRSRSIPSTRCRGIRGRLHIERNRACSSQYLGPPLISLGSQQGRSIHHRHDCAVGPSGFPKTRGRISRGSGRGVAKTCVEVVVHSSDKWPYPHPFPDHIGLAPPPPKAHKITSLCIRLYVVGDILVLWREERL